MVNPEDVEPPFACQQMEYDGQELWIPYLTIGFDDAQLVLHHFNTVVRLFENESANHVEVRDGKQLKGLRMTQDMLDLMIEYDYSYKWDRFVDEHTMNWLVELEVGHIDEELDEL